MGYLEKRQIDALGSKILLRIMIHMLNKKKSLVLKTRCSLLNY